MHTIARHCPLLTYLTLEDLRPLNTTAEVPVVETATSPSLQWHLAHAEMSTLGLLEVDTA